MSASTSNPPIATVGIVVGMDGSPQSEEALRWAAAQARLTGQQLHAVIAWEVPINFGVAVMADLDWRQDSADLLRKTIAHVLPEADGDRVERHVRQGHPARVLLDAAAGADLLVVGSRGHGGFAGMLLGSVSQYVVAHAPCPVVVVRASAQPAAG
jgi:nucleotide-binding universal stress UspA family protein